MNNGSVIYGFVLLMFQQRWAPLSYGRFIHTPFCSSIKVSAVTPPGFQVLQAHGEPGVTLKILLPKIRQDGGPG